MMNTSSSTDAVRHPWTYTKEVTETIRVEDVYPSGIEIPLGYEEIGFGPPKAGQPFLLQSYGTAFTASSRSYDHDLSQPRILLKKKDLCFKVGDCFDVCNEGDYVPISFIRVTEAEPGKRTGRGLVMFRKQKNPDTWGCHDTGITLGKEEKGVIRRPLSRATFDRVFIDKIVNRVPA